MSKLYDAPRERHRDAGINPPDRAAGRRQDRNTKAQVRRRQIELEGAPYRGAGGHQGLERRPPVVCEPMALEVAVDLSCKDRALVELIHPDVDRILRRPL